MGRSTVFDVYQDAYYKAATKTFFSGFNPVRNKASFVYTGVGSGGIGATSGQVNVSNKSSKEVYYKVGTLASASLALSIEGRHSLNNTWMQATRIVLTAVQATYYKGYLYPYKPDFFRVGVRAASPAAVDAISVYGAFK